CQHYNSSPFTF
nr:immunoglobulin light chain junction region [Macaca mulatta]MOV61572.1 immunoglobulin light chain junction region [Macaca mulatta]MOV61906.1 immunoglobulin light chain junction region [Macaca mulatta]MOV63293.1 immunoglobulin light chain junction region [Macaca mulatta]MOV64117.1 immunoglobulin light chain junction region [Macaca mulatta]